MENKKGGAGLWILIALIVIAVGVGFYFLFSGSGEVEGYEKEVQEFNTDTICEDIDGYGEYCMKVISSTSYIAPEEYIEVVLVRMVSGLDVQKNFFNSICENQAECNKIKNTVITMEDSSHASIGWYFSEEKMISIKQQGNNIKSESSPVVRYYLNKYPPVQF